MNDRAGFTLLELMIVIAIFAVLSTIAIPNLFGWLPHYRLGSGARTVLSALQYARSAAIKEFSRSSVSFDATGANCNVFLDNGAGGGTAGNGLHDGGEKLLKQIRLPSGIRVFSNLRGTKGVSFDTRGVIINNYGSEYDLILMSNANHTKTIKINAIGHSRIWD